MKQLLKKQHKPNKQRSQIIKRMLSISITALFGIWLYVNRSSLLESLSGIRPEYFVLVVLGQILVIIANSNLLRYTLRPLKVDIGFVEAYKVTSVSSFANFFTPLVGGVSTKALYLKSKHGLLYSSFVGTVYGNYIIMLLLSFILGFLGVIVASAGQTSTTGLFLLTFFGLGTLVLLFFVLFGHRLSPLILRARPKNSFVRKMIAIFSSIDAGWNTIRKDTRSLAMIFFWTAGTLISLMFVYWSATMSIGINGSVGSYMIYASLASVSLLFNFTPGGIGVREALYAGTQSLTKIATQSVVAFLLIDRAGQLVVVGFCWLFFGHDVLKHIRIKKTKTSDSK